MRPLTSGSASGGRVVHRVTAPAPPTLSCKAVLHPPQPAHSGVLGHWTRSGSSTRLHAGEDAFSNVGRAVDGALHVRSVRSELRSVCKRHPRRGSASYARSGRVRAAFAACAAVFPDLSKLVIDGVPQVAKYTAKHVASDPSLPANNAASCIRPSTPTAVELSSNAERLAARVDYYPHKCQRRRSPF
jgi:hypothetical protein